MRSFPILIALLAAASPVSAADDLGRRTVAPARMLAQMNQADPEAELQREIAAAASHPLGSLDNPIRVGGPEGERAYLARLRCADGSTPRIGPMRPGGVGAFGSLVELFPLDCGAAAPGKAALLLDMYHEEHVENAAPDGFRIVAR